MNGIPTFRTSRFESQLIDQIVERADREFGPLDRLTLNMDITACHANGCPLDLNQLLAAEEADFGHDIHGIQHYLNRRTGQLTDVFVPRCSLA